MASLPAQIYEKFCIGDPLSDVELQVGIEHFGKMAEMLMKSGPAFKIAAKEANMVTERLEQYLNARQERR